MAGMAMRANFIRRLQEAGNEQDRLVKELSELERVAQQAAKDIRTMMFGLRPLMLETKGLISTLETYVQQLQNEPWKTHLIVEGFGIPDTDNEVRLPQKSEAAIFIIIQEAINNIRKHAQPTNVWISLINGQNECVVTIQDDGKGFDSETVLKGYTDRGSFGLLNMGERARLINAQYELKSRPGEGTTVKVVLPHTGLPQVSTAPLMVTMPGYSASQGK
jgi:signal transduction histidine kinase